MRANRYMSDDSHEYVGTVTSWKLFKSVSKGRSPKVAAKTDWEAKVTHNTQVLKELRKVLDGPFKDQFAGRLDDAIAVAEHNWKRFSNSIGEIPAARRALPTELAAKMLRAGKRQPTRRRRLRRRRFRRHRGRRWGWRPPGRHRCGSAST